jgi:hypothetical protein
MILGEEALRNLDPAQSLLWSLSTEWTLAPQSLPELNNLFFFKRV